MSRIDDAKAARLREGGAPKDDPGLDEAAFLAELRLAVEGACTQAEERLARQYPELRERLGRVFSKPVG